MVKHPDCMRAGCWYQQQGYNACGAQQADVCVRSKEAPRKSPVPPAAASISWLCTWCGLSFQTPPDFTGTAMCACGKLMERIAEAPDVSWNVTVDMGNFAAAIEQASRAMAEFTQSLSAICDNTEAFLAAWQDTDPAQPLLPPHIANDEDTLSWYRIITAGEGSWSLLPQAVSSDTAKVTPEATNSAP